MSDKLRPFQETGVLFLNNVESIFHCRYQADDMGLGKTIQAAVAAAQAGLIRVLVICPAALRYNWQREWREWYVPEYQRVFGAPGPELQVLSQLADEPLATGPAVCSFEYATKNAALLSAGRPWQLVIVDEAHFVSFNLEEKISKRASALLGAAGVCRHAYRVWPLSGTPIRNHAGNLWPWLSFAGLTELSYRQWIKAHCVVVPGDYGPQIKGTKEESLPEIRKLLRDSGFMIRRKKIDVSLELPPMTYGEITVESAFDEEKDEFLLQQFPKIFIDHRGRSADARAAIKEQAALESQLAARSLGDPSIFTEPDYVRLQILSKGTSTLQRYNGLAKAKPVADIIKMRLDADPNCRVFIVCINKGPIEALRVHLKDYGVRCLYGGTDPQKRDAFIASFQDPKSSTRAIVGQIQASGTGVTLTAASWIVILQCPWVPGDLLQVIDRVARIGQRGPCQCDYVTLANDGIDQSIMGNLRRKSKQIAEMVDAPNSPATGKVIRIEDLM